MTQADMQRHQTLDIVRGVAVMGILLMNIQAYALPEAAYFMPIGPQSQSVADQSVWFVDYVFFSSKMRTLFSILFGASCLLIIERAWASGQSAAKVHYSRMVWLFLFGLAHFIFVWWGDILSLYALSGLLLFFARNLSAKALWRWAIGLLVLDSFLFGTQSALGLMIWSGALPESLSPDMVDEMNKGFGYIASQYSADVALMTGNYAGILRDRLDALPDQVGFWIALQIGTLGLMFLGMALYRNGFLTGQWEAARYRKWAWVSFAFAIPPQIAFAVWAMATDYDPMVAFAINLGFVTPFTTIMAVGIAALIILLWQTASSNALWPEVLARTGQMAFSNYLGTSLVMTTIFYGYGFGQFGQVSRAALFGVTLIAFAAMMSASWFWLARFRYGPLEWVWRSLARAKVQPMRRMQNGAKGAPVDF